MYMRKLIISCMALAMLVACSNSKGNNARKEERTTVETKVPEGKENPAMTFLHKEEPVNTADLPVLDMKKEYPKKTIALQDIADVEYIVLESHEDGLVGHQDIIVTDSFIITQREMEDIVFFKRDGSFSHYFSRKGGSGEEYSRFVDLCVDPLLREVYIHDWQRHKLQVYTYEGEYKRTLKVRAEGYTWGKIHCLSKDTRSLLMEDLMNVNGKVEKHTNPRPYYMISATDGEVSRLPLTIKKRIGNSVSYYDKESDRFISISTSISPISNINGRLIFADFALDTVYQYQDKHFVPIAKKENWMKEDGIPWLVAPDAVTEDFFMWTAIEKDYNKTILPTRTFLQNRHTGKCIQVKLIDRNVTEEGYTFHKPMTANCHILPDNTVLQYYRSYELLELYEGGKLQGELKEIASKLSEEDNPIIMLAKFK